MFIDFSKKLNEVLESPSDSPKILWNWEMDNNGILKLKTKKLKEGVSLYLYISEHSVYIVNEPIAEDENDIIWRKKLLETYKKSDSGEIKIDIGTFVLPLVQKDINGNYSYGYDGKTGVFYLFLDSKKAKISKPFIMKSDGELSEFPKYLEENNGVIEYDTTLNLPYIASSTSNKEESNKKGFKVDVSQINKMLDKPLEEDEVLYIAPINKKEEDGSYKHYLYPIFRAKENVKKETDTKGDIRKK